MSARSLVLPVLFLALQPGFARAQTFQGAVRGAVHDPGGIVTGATVQLREENTDLERTAATNDRGAYAFTNVWPNVLASASRTCSTRCSIRPRWSGGNAVGST
jgi:hypothetical protein